jgi:hypothetical protein
MISKSRVKATSSWVTTIFFVKLEFSKLYIEASCYAVGWAQ